MCCKIDWLAERGIDHAWPMHGRPKQIVVDSAKEFQSGTFNRGCADYGISICMRNKGTVHRGGVIKRLLGKVNTALRALRGKTGRSIADRGDYASEARARLSFADLERCIALAIIDHNLSQNARKLTVPAKEWEDRFQPKDRSIDVSVDELLNFLPRKTRKISTQGISLFAIDYFEPGLGPLVARRDRRDRLDPIDLCYDPRDISHVFVKDPDTQAWRPVRRRDGLAEPITLWQHQADRQRRCEIQRRPVREAAAIRREIAAAVAAAKTPKSWLKEMPRARHATEAKKPYADFAAPSAQAPGKARPGSSAAGLPCRGLIGCTTSSCPP